MAQANLIDTMPTDQTDGESQPVESQPWLIQVKKRFERQYKIQVQCSHSVTIYRVPKSIVALKREAYVPQVVAFGPYHRNMNPQLSAMDEHKLEAVRRILTRLNNITINTLITEVQQLEKEIRDCYEGPVDYSGETFAWMCTMDACFILEFLRTPKRRYDQKNFSLVFQNAGHRNAISWEIMKDILKLENQIPLFLLIRILQLELRSRETAMSTLATILSHFDEFRGFPFSLEQSQKLGRKEQIKLRIEAHIKMGACHLLDLCRKIIKDFLTYPIVPVTPAPSTFECNVSSKCQTLGWTGSTNQWLRSNNDHHSDCIKMGKCISTYFTSKQKFGRNVDDGMSIASAKLLRSAGIRFRPGKIWFAKKSFRRSTLFLPQIKVEHSTETHLRNLMAFEECQSCGWYPEKTVILRFMLFVDYLIDSEQDVALLRKEGIITTALGSNQEIACMFNNLCKGITVRKCDEFEKVVKRVRRHCRSRCSVWISQFRREHCSKPWYVVSLLAGMLILSLTAAQTFYAARNSSK
ncbi:hypothetical protein SUGI_0714700 [Cryptomeria japonica]|uniref:putative UPF0481 protein At3g02645 n=1 Tax=Cryptomeria japonica TaxID=3369 RepID=UPI002414974B|nr:putative UPF0481 protein At3g02645 [Cryptomeria japonica]GLJ35544.1 hypothetical protein SUGI_0714700 [Cryptomeria japonica]